MSSRPTIRMVAERAQVSRGTVDRVLNNRAYVSADVRARVLEAIRETGYIAPQEVHRQQLAEPRQSLRLGVLQPNWTGFWRRGIDQGVEQAQVELEEFGVEILSRSCETDVPQEAVELLEELAAEGVSGLAICLMNDPAVQQAVSALADAGIPSITFNSDLTDSRRLCFVGQDIRKAGRIAGELMYQCVPQGGRILATLGNLKFEGHRQRLEGFCQRLAELGVGEEQIVIAETYNDYATAARVVAEALAQYPDIGGIYMANRSVAACAESVRAAGRLGKVRIICHDVNESTRRLLLSGQVALTISQDLQQQGYAPLILLRELLQKGKPPDLERFNNRISVICAENL